MSKEQALIWTQIASAAAVLVGVFLVVIQLKQNEELLRYQIATDLRANRDALRSTTLGETYSETLAKLSRPLPDLTRAELHQFNVHALSIYYELTHRAQLTQEGIFIEGWRTWLLEDRCLLFDNPTGKAWLDWQERVGGGDEVIEQVCNDLSQCKLSFPDFVENKVKSRG